jgi:hypothetical protein
MNTTKEEVDNAINQRDYQDVYGKLGEYLKDQLGISFFAFTETQRLELNSKRISTCDLVEVGLEPGKFKRTLGAIGVYKGAALLFRFCDNSQYKVILSDISVDGYSYHPNRFGAAFGRINTPRISYDEKNKLRMRKLPIYKRKDKIDSILSVSTNPIVGLYQSLGYDKNSVNYQIALVEIAEKLVCLYTGGHENDDWSYGELKAELTATKSSKIYLCKWYTHAKEPIETTIIFNDDNTFDLKSISFNDKYVKIK